MMRAMYSAVTGLRTHLGKMDTIGNNLANVNTVGFKKGQVTFKDYFSQTQRGASAAKPGGIGGLNPMQIGMGVGTSAIDVIHTRMGGMRTDNPTDVMIEGDGFFVISPKETGDGEKFYTRAGNFRRDNLGNLVTPEGYHVLGYRYNYGDVDPVTGKRPKLETEQIVGMRINESETTPPTETKGIQLRGNLDARYAKDQIYLTDTTVFDTLGNAYNITFQMKMIDETADGQKWEASIVRMTDVASGQYMDNVDADGKKNPITGVTLGSGNTLELEFDKNGVLTKVGGTAVDDKPKVDIKIDPQSITFNKYQKKDVEAEKATKIRGNIGEGGSGLINLFDPEKDNAYTSLTQYANDITIMPYRQEGSTSGSLTGFSIGQNGDITGTFSNGDTKLLGRLLLAKFDNPMGLEKVANNMFRESRNSGEPQLGMGKSAGFGAIAAGTLEMSNVDMAQEFTDIITTQRGFQANSRVITTSDEMLQELVNIKR